MNTRQSMASVLAGLVISLGAPAHAYEVLEPGSMVNGRSIADWTAQWWTWAWSSSANANPLADTTGAWATLNNDGPVFFVAGGNTSATYERTFSVPAGTPLLVPMINYWENCVGDPAASCNASYLPDPKVQMAANVGALKSTVTDLHMSIDGVPISQPFLRWEVSDFFSGGTGIAGTTLAALYEGAGLPYVGLDISPSLVYGYYAMITGLEAGPHTLVFGGSETGYGTTYEVTARINVVAVPEPSSALLMLLGMCAVWRYRRRSVRAG